MHREPDAWKLARPVREERWRNLSPQGDGTLHLYFHHIFRKLCKLSMETLAEGYPLFFSRQEDWDELVTAFPDAARSTATVAVPVTSYNSPSSTRRATVCARVLAPNLRRA